MLKKCSEKLVLRDKQKSHKADFFAQKIQRISGACKALRPKNQADKLAYSIEWRAIQTALLPVYAVK